MLTLLACGEGKTNLQWGDMGIEMVPLGTEPMHAVQARGSWLA